MTELYKRLHLLDKPTKLGMLFVEVLRLGVPQSHSVLYPDLLAIGVVNCDMSVCIVRQDYTGAHFHAHLHRVRSFSVF